MPAPSLEQRRHALVVLLTVNAGATDAIGFLMLGGAFTSVMTGNLVLFGIALAHWDGELLRHTLVAIGCFIGGCVLGTRLAGTARTGQATWPAAVTRAVAVEFGVFVIFAVGWWLTGSHPTGAVQLTLLAANAVALGIQSSSVQRFGVSGLSTTYMTGTLTTLIVRLTSGQRVKDVADSLQLLLALVTGAVAAALLARYAVVIAPLIQLVTVGVVLLGGILLGRSGAGADAASAAVPSSRTAPGSVEVAGTDQ